MANNNLHHPQYMRYPYPGQLPPFQPGLAPPVDGLPPGAFPSTGSTSEMEQPDRNNAKDDGNRGKLRRAHHTALERKRRDHIKDMFNTLQAEVDLPNNDKASRAMVLTKAREQILEMSEGNDSMQKEIEEIKRNNERLLEQIQLLETNSNK